MQPCRKLTCSVDQPSLWTECVRVFPKPALILLVLFQRDVTGMGAREQGVPFLLRQLSSVDSRPAAPLDRETTAC